MPTRVLQHGFAPTIENVGLEPGLWNDIPKHGQFLLDLEFITRYTNPQGASCIYRKSPPYLKEIASQFPWVHFYAYEHTEPCKSINPEDGTSEYDPDRPEILMADVPLLVEVNSNMTTSKMKLTNSIARRLSEASAHGCKVLICHGANHDQQLCLHSILKPSSSLLDISGNIPVDYYEGEIILPIFIPNNKIFACLAVSQNARCKFYNPSLYQDEIAFFQGVIRTTESYDNTSRDVITSEFARYTHKIHGCPEDILRLGLMCTVDIIQASTT